MKIPQEVFCDIFSFLEIFEVSKLSRVHKCWNAIASSNQVLSNVAKRAYAHHLKINLKKWVGNWSTLLRMRPRVLFGGLYSLKYEYIKPITRDMWTTVPKGVILKVIYYRHLTFLEDGRCLYR